MKALSGFLADWFSSTRLDEIPDGVRRRARLAIADAIGVGIAASQSDAGGPYCYYGEFRAAGSGATLLTGGEAEASEAALVNGGLIHSLEFDDTHTASIIHGSSVVLPAALALAECNGLSGGEFMRVYSVGYEMLIRIGLAAPGELQDRGFQVTSLAGAMVASGMAATVMGLSKHQCVDAIGISLSQAAGSMEFLSNGSSVKSLHPGWAAHSGIKAAQFAQAGITGPASAFEGRYGYFSLFASSDGREAADRVAGVSGKWHIEEIATKFYPCCHYIHPFLEAAGILRARRIEPADVERVVLFVAEGAAAVICDPWETKLRPPTSHAMRWSLPMCFANMFLTGAAGLDMFEKPPDRLAQEFANRIAWKPFLETSFPRRFDALVHCHLADGETIEIHIDDALGNASRPPAEADIWEKFDANLRLSDGHDAGVLRSMFENLEDMASLEPLSRALRAGFTRQMGLI